MTGARFIGTATGSLHARRASAENVDRSIDVGIRGEPAVSASEAGLALSARFVDDAAIAARLAGVGGIDLRERPAALLQFVRQFSLEGAPTLRADVAIQAALVWSARRHGDDVQIFQSDRAETPRNLSSGAMLPIGSDAGDPCGNAGRTPTLLSVSVGTALAARENALSLRPSPFQVPRARRGQQFARGKSKRVRNAAVDTNRGQRARRCIVLDLYREADMPAKSIMGDGRVHNLAANGSCVAVLDQTYFRQSDRGPTPALSADSDVLALEAETVVDALASMLGEAGPTREEVGHRSIKVAQRLRERHAWNATDPINLSPQLCNLASLSGEIEDDSVGPRLSPKVASLLQSEIVNEAGHARDLPEPFFLLGRRRKAITKGPLNHVLFLAHRGAK